MNPLHASLAAALTLALGAASAQAAAPAATSPLGTKNVVIIPDAYVDGSGWRAVHDILSRKGYKVSVVQAPHTSLDDDIAVARKIVYQQFGQVVLVGSGIGGTVVSNVATGKKVKALVFVAALAPEVGETSAQLLASMPAAGDAVKVDRAGFHWLDAEKFQRDFGADLPPNQASFMAGSQVPVTNTTMGTPSWFAMWHQKPSYGIVATEDRLVSPALQRWMYERAGAKVTELKASHAVYISQPEEVATVIERAALANP
ncbi:MAG: alpha/beta hydrolase [Pseudomonadota bacterium]